MLKTIPWDTIGPAAIAALAILAIVFAFILKFQKESKPSARYPTNPPRDVNSMNKKTICFKHEGEIASNKTAIGIFGASLKEANKENSDAHGRIFDKLEEQGKEIIREIKKVNGNG